MLLSGLVLSSSSAVFAGGPPGLPGSEGGGSEGGAGEEGGGSAGMDDSFTAEKIAELEERYGHALTDANLHEIASWRIDDLDWWLDADRNQASLHKIRYLRDRVSNANETTIDVRQHDALFGVHYLSPDLSDADDHGALKVELGQRPDLVVLHDEARQFLEQLLRPHLPSSPFAGGKELEAKALELANLAEVRSQLGFLDYAASFGLLDADTEAFLFLRAALIHVFPETSGDFGTLLADAEARLASFQGDLQGYLGADIRQPYQDLVLAREQEAHDLTKNRVDAFLGEISSDAGEYFLRYLVHVRILPRVETHYIVPTEDNLAFFTSLDQNLRGNTPDWNVVRQQSSPRLISGSYSAVWSDVLVEFEKDREMTCNANGSVSTPGLARWLPWTELGNPRVEVSSDIKEILLLLQVNASAQPRFVGPFDFSSEYPHGPNRDWSETCGVPPTSWYFDAAARTRECVLDDFADEDQYEIHDVGLYQVTTNTKAELSRIPAASFDGGDYSGRVEVVHAGDVQTRLNFPVTNNSYFISVDPWARNTEGNTVSESLTFTCCENPPSSCPENASLKDCACQCDRPYFPVFDEQGNLQSCKTRCEIDPELCKRPTFVKEDGMLRNITRKLVPPVPDLPADPFNCLEWEYTYYCVEVSYFDDQGNEVPLTHECTELKTCAKWDTPFKTLPCPLATEDDHWWFLCDSDMKWVDDFPAEAYCRAGESRCVAGDAQFCRPDGLWGTTYEFCDNGCDEATGACILPPPAICETGETRCVDSDTVQYCQDGQWGETEVCAAGCNTVFQGCDATGACQSGDRRCAQGGSTVQLCNFDQWGSHIVCPYGCDASTRQCNVSSPNCDAWYPGICHDPGERSCNGFGDVLTCDFNAEGCLEWQLTEACAEGCTDGTCAGSGCSGDAICTLEGAGRCPTAGSSEICQRQADGCLRWDAPAEGGNCAADQVCSSGVCSDLLCITNADCATTSGNCQNGTCRPCEVDSDCGSLPWRCSEQTGRCWAAF